AGAAIEVDVWSLDAAALGTFLTMIPAPLALGTVELDDGSTRTGFVAEGRAVDGATEITDFGGWRAYVASR
ncbi:MAG: allophanate hydrolase-related protein, partial [Acidimicrobiales bacterium]